MLVPNPAVDRTLLARRGRLTATAAVAAVLLVAAVLVMVPTGSASARELPTITMTATPATIASGQAVTLEADVTDPELENIELYRVYFCLSPSESCDFGGERLLGITFGTHTGPGTAHYRIATTGRPLDDTMTSFENLPTGSYEVSAWYQYARLDGTTVIDTVTSEPVSLTVGEPTAPTILTDVLPAGTVGTEYSATLAATGLPAPAWQATGLPDGVTLDASSGELSGTPTTAGDFPVQVTAGNGVAPDAVASFLVTIAAATTPPAITTTTLPGGSVGVPYSVTLTGSGQPPPTWAATGLPPGLTLDPASGVLAGTPTTAGSFAVEVTATNGVPPDAVARFTLVVAGTPTAPVITTASLPAGTAGQRYATTLRATGFPAPTWKAVGLPSGFALDPVTGEVRGVPGSPGSWTVKVTATNGVPPAAVRTLTLTIAPAPRVPAVTFTPASVDFGAQRVGTTTRLTVTVTNSGDADLLLAGASADPPFAVVEYRTGPRPPGSCARLVGSPNQVGALSPRESCTEIVEFTATATGPAVGALTLRGSGRGLAIETWQLPLAGLGTAPGTTAPSAAFSPSLLDFGDQRPGRASPARSVTVTNTGTAPLGIVSVSSTGPFRVLDGRDGRPGSARTCGSLRPVGGLPTLDVGGSCVIVVDFWPPGTQVAPYTGVLALTGSGGSVVNGTWRLPLRGSTPAPDVAFDPPSLGFGDLPLGTTATADVTITNIGSADLEMARLSTAIPFLLRGTGPHDCLRLVGPGGSHTLQAGASCTIRVTFRPIATGPVAGEVVLTGSGGTGGSILSGTWRLTMTGNGTS